MNEMDTIVYKTEIEELKEEIEYMMEENEKMQMNEGFSKASCSIQLPIFQNPLFLSGPGNTILSKFYSSYTPDLFRQCWLSPNINYPQICPNVNINSNVTSYLQKLIEPNLIKAFLYFGFSSNIFTNYNIPIGKRNPENESFLLFLNDFKKNLFTQNYGNFDGFAFYFINKYPSYTLLYQISIFIHQIGRYHLASSVGTIACNYRIPWEASALCIDKIYTLNELNFTFNIALMNNIYQTYTVWSSNPKNNKLTLLTFFLEYRSFFEILDYTKEVLTDVVLQFSYQSTKKEYCIKEYMKPKYYQECLRLYEIYKENKLRLSF